jgi:hypothetical protein
VKVTSRNSHVFPDDGDLAHFGYFSFTCLVFLTLAWKI